MGQGKRAWIYCAIDAPEDRNGALKSQFKQLIDYCKPWQAVQIIHAARKISDPSGKL